MKSNTNSRATWVREELLQLLSVSGTLAGLAITGVAMFRSLGRETMSTTIADDLLAVAALIFLLCSYIIFFGLRTEREALARKFERFVDLLFLLGLTVMVASGFIMVYSVI